MSLRQLVDDMAHELRRQSRNAARRNKPTMWAYYAEMAAWAERVLKVEDIALVLHAYAHVEPVELEQDPVFAARRWAQGIYARRILRAAGVTVPNPSLAWLRERAA